MTRLRVASLQYFIRPIQTFDQFRDQVVGLVETAADYGSRLVVFPEYFTLQLLTLSDVKRRLPDQIRDLAAQEDNFLDLVSHLATRHQVYIVAGTIPHLNEAGARRDQRWGRLPRARRTLGCGASPGGADRSR